MVNPGSIIGKITEELGELGKKIVTETAKAPVDIIAGTFNKSRPQEEKPKEEKEQIPPRQMLEQFARKTKPEPSIFEKKKMEEQEEKETTQKQAAAAAWQQLPNTGSAARRGDPRNIAKKQAGPETGKNIVNQ